MAKYSIWLTFFTLASLFRDLIVPPTGGLCFNQLNRFNIVQLRETCRTNGKIQALGGVVVDPLLGGEGRLLQCPSGTPANVAVGVARFGGDSGFIGRVGNDPSGHFVRHTLAQEQVGVNYVRLDAAQRTSTVVVDSDQHGERTFTLMVRPGTDLFFQPEDLPPFTIGQWPHIHSIALSAKPSRSMTFAATEMIKRAGGYVGFSPNIRSDLWQDPQDLRDCPDQALALADAIKLSEEESAFVNDGDNTVSGVTRPNTCFQSTLLLVIQGKAEVQAALRGQVSHFPARPVMAVDATDAGDAFVTGLLAGLATHGIPDSLAALAPDPTLAQTYDTLAITAEGVMAALPYRDDPQRSL